MFIKTPKQSKHTEHGNPQTESLFQYPTKHHAHRVRRGLRRVRVSGVAQNIERISALKSEAEALAMCEMDPEACVVEEVPYAEMMLGSPTGAALAKAALAVGAQTLSPKPQTLNPKP